MDDLPIPLSRVDLYLAVAAGMDGVTLPEKPLSRLEQFLAVIAGDTTVELPIPASLTELWLNYVAGGALTDEMKLVGAYWIGAQKVDVRFFAIAGGMEGVEAPQPQNRTEQYWARIAEIKPIHGVLKYVTGTSIALTDVVSGITSLENVYGDTFQQTYSGKNLFNYQAVNNLALSATIITNEAYRGYSLPAQQGDTFTISRSSTSENNRFRVCFTIVEPAQGVVFYDSDGNSEKFIDLDNSLQGTFTVPAGMSYVFVYLSNSNQTISEDLHIQLEKGSTATTYEPYVGGTPAPNPDYPQTVNVVTGTQSVWMHGKNLAYTGWAEDFVTRVNDSTKARIEQFDGRNILNIAASAGYQDYDNKYIFKIDFKENTVYTFSFDLYTTSMHSNILIQYTDGTTTALSTQPSGNWAHRVLKSTANKTIKYLRVQYSQDRSYIDLNTFMVEESSTATTYEPYIGANYTIDLGNTELCKISTYKDYIYKSGDDWYVHKAVGKAVLDGSENWNIDNSGQSNWYYVANIYSKIHAATPPYPLPVHEWAYSTHYINEYIPQGNNKGFAVFTATNVVNIRIKEQTEDTLANFKIWLAANLPKFYIPIATPTETKITDATLIGQLNALDAATLPKPNATITVTPSGTNLAGALKISYYGEEE